MKIRNLMLALAGTTLVFSACEKDPDPKVPTMPTSLWQPSCPIPTE